MVIYIYWKGAWVFTKNNKIVKFDKLADIITNLKRENKKVILCNGVFDLIHIGHIRHFKQAKKHGDVLITTVISDDLLDKTEGRPAFKAKSRAESVAALDSVDYVAINNCPTVSDTIKFLKPSIYLKGIDNINTSGEVTGGFLHEQEAIKSVGGKLQLTDEITFSSSDLINRFFSFFSKETDDFITEFSKRYSTSDLFEYIDQIRDLKILVVGEAIIDEYQYGNSIGKSNKESIIALKYQSKEKFAGGSLAIANQVANFCDNVDLFTVLGEKETQEEFIDKKLNKKIKRIFHYKKNSPTIVKRRFIEQHPLRKLLEFYVFDDSKLDKKQSKEIIEHLNSIIDNYDVVIVSDFGHGMFNHDMIKLISDKSNFVGINTQTNAGNTGYNTVSKYPRADYICIDEPEVRLDAQDKETPLEEIINNLSTRLDCNNISITKGVRGCLTYSNGKFYNIPVLSGKVVDNMGAGDAFLSVTTPLVSIGTPMDIVGFIGNAIGAMAVTIVGNKESIDKSSLSKYIRTVINNNNKSE